MDALQALATGLTIACGGHILGIGVVLGDRVRLVTIGLAHDGPSCLALDLGDGLGKPVEARNLQLRQSELLGNGWNAEVDGLLKPAVEDGWLGHCSGPSPASRAGPDARPYHHLV